MNGVNAFDGMLFYSDRFPEVEVYNNSRQVLSEAAGISVDKLDATLGSLTMLEEHLQAFGIDQNTDPLWEPKLFTALARYVAEVVVRTVDGEIEMYLDTEFRKTWVPWIVSRDAMDRRRYHSLYDLVKAQEHDQLCLAAIVDGSIRYPEYVPG